MISQERLKIEVKLLLIERNSHICSVIFVLVYFLVAVLVLVCQLFLVLVSFQFYSIGDFRKHVMMFITSHQHILHQHIADCHT